MDCLESSAGCLTLTFTNESTEPFSVELFQKIEETLNSVCDSFSHFLKEEVMPVLEGSPSEVIQFTASAVLCQDERMIELNRDFRGKDKTTDVLSFALFENLRSGEEMIFPGQGEIELGDIFISAPVLAKQAEEYKLSLLGEFHHLLTHGFLHLCGFDHEISDAEEKVMEAHEKRIIDSIYDKN